MSRASKIRIKRQIAAKVPMTVPRMKLTTGKFLPLRVAGKGETLVSFDGIADRRHDASPVPYGARDARAVHFLDRKGPSVTANPWTVPMRKL